MVEAKGERAKLKQVAPGLYVRTDIPPQPTREELISFADKLFTPDSVEAHVVKQAIDKFYPQTNTEIKIKP